MPMPKTPVPTVTRTLRFKLRRESYPWLEAASVEVPVLVAIGTSALPKTAMGIDLGLHATVTWNRRSPLPSAAATGVRPSDFTARPQDAGRTPCISSVARS